MSEYKIEEVFSELGLQLAEKKQLLHTRQT